MRRSAAALAALLAATPVLAEISAGQLAGKTLVSGKGARIAVGADGSFRGSTDKGEPLAGTWEVRDGRWCRTIAEPKRLAGSECQGAVLKHGKLTLTRADGSKVSFTVE
jgi:hypothetical protein